MTFVAAAWQAAVPSVDAGTILTAIVLLATLAAMAMMYRITKEFLPINALAPLQASVEQLRADYKEADFAARDQYQSEVLRMSENYTAEVQRLVDLVTRGSSQEHADALEIRGMIQRLEVEFRSLKDKLADQAEARGRWEERVDGRVSRLEQDERKKA